MIAFLAVLTVGFIYEWKQGRPGLGVIAQAADGHRGKAGVPRYAAAPDAITWPFEREGDRPARSKKEGFVVTKLNKLVNWARTASMLADDLRPRLLRRRDDACRRVPRYDLDRFGVVFRAQRRASRT